ncbi:MAG: hypothetical protein R2874_16310 [Desulfobacterales bacterium]
MKILHVIGQRPERTGGIYLQAVAREAAKAGHTIYGGRRAVRHDSGI